jgi:hypothetical protein
MLPFFDNRSALIWGSPTAAGALGSPPRAEGRAEVHEAFLVASVAESNGMQRDQEGFGNQDPSFPMPDQPTRLASTDWVIVFLLLVCILLRVVTWMVCLPTSRPNDTEEYVALAYRFMTRDFRNYGAERTPVYPVLLLTTKFNFLAVWFIQSLLGIATSLLLYAMTKDRTNNRVCAFFTGASNSVFLNQLMFEPFIMTETLAAFVLVLSLFLYLRFWQNCNSSRRVCHKLMFVLGVVLGLATLLRPLFLHLPLLFAVYLWTGLAQMKSGIRQRVSLVAMLVLPAFLLVLGWSIFNYVEAGYFGPTTSGGYSLMNHSGAFIEFAPDRYAIIREIYLHHRQMQVASLGYSAGTIWKAYPYMLEATGYSYVQLSRQLTRLSLWLFIHHPLLYTRHVGLSLRQFWRADFYQPTLRLDTQSVNKALALIWLIQRRLLIFLYFLFFLATVHLLFSAFIRRRLQLFEFRFLPIAIVLVGCLGQALVEFGENARYEVPYQSLVIFATCCWLAERHLALRGR